MDAEQEMDRLARKGLAEGLQDDEILELFIDHDIPRDKAREVLQDVKNTLRKPGKSARETLADRAPTAGLSGDENGDTDEDEQEGVDVDAHHGDTEREGVSSEETSNTDTQTFEPLESDLSEEDSESQGGLFSQLSDLVSSIEWDPQAELHSLLSSDSSDTGEADKDDQGGLDDSDIEALRELAEEAVNIGLAEQEILDLFSDHGISESFAKQLLAEVRGDDTDSQEALGEEKAVVEEPFDEDVDRVVADEPTGDSSNDVSDDEADQSDDAFDELVDESEAFDQDVDTVVADEPTGDSSNDVSDDERGAFDEDNVAVDREIDADDDVSEEDSVAGEQGVVDEASTSDSDGDPPSEGGSEEDGEDSFEEQFDELFDPDEEGDFEDVFDDEEAQERMESPSSDKSEASSKDSDGRVPSASEFDDETLQALAQHGVAKGFSRDDLISFLDDHGVEETRAARVVNTVLPPPTEDTQGRKQSEHEGLTEAAEAKDAVAVQKQEQVATAKEESFMSDMDKSQESLKVGRIYLTGRKPSFGRMRVQGLQDITGNEFESGGREGFIDLSDTGEHLGIDEEESGDESQQVEEDRIRETG